MTKIFTSPLGNIKNLYHGNAAQFMRESPELNANLNKTVLIDAETGKGLTSREFFDLMGKLHHVLVTKYGIKYDDVVCLFAPNSIYIPSVQHGILSSGAIVSPANVAYNKDELNYQLKTAQAKLLITSGALKETATQAAAMEGAVAEHIILIEDLIKEASRATKIETPVELRGKTAEHKDAYYCFSSGTSGVPKCVQTTHLNMTSNIQQTFQAGGDFYNSKQVFGGLLPMTHIYGLNKFVFAVLGKAETNVVFPKFDFELLLQCISKYKICQLHVVPPILVLFAKSPLVDKYPAIKNCLERVMSGAAPLSKSLIDEAEKRLGVTVAQGYGLTETSPLTHFFAYDWERYNKASIGWLIIGQEARVVDPDGNDVDIGQRGELYLRGPNIMKGYLHNEKATKEVITPEGWFKTGDIAVVDETEQFYIVDRAKELIKSKGHQVAPAELEGLLLKHPNVADCAVTGVYSESEATEYPRAFVVIKGECTPLKIKQWLDDKVARHKNLWGGVVELDAIPKSPSGKILRRLLRDRKGDKVHGVKEAKL